MSSESNQNDGNENLNPIEKKKRGGSQKKSWVWDWFEADETGARGVLRIRSIRISGHPSEI